MEAVFISKGTDLYNGNYSFTKREATNEANYGMHYHDFYEIQFYISDTSDTPIGHITINGKKRDLFSGALVLINMFDVHNIEITTKKPYIRYCISFDSSLLMIACSQNTNLFNIFSSTADTKFLKPLSEEQKNSFESIYRRREKIALKNGVDIMEKALILEIFATVYDTFFDGQEASASDLRGMGVIADLINYINANISEPFSLESLAQHANFSTFHLSHMFKKHTGTTLNKYIITKRIDKAKGLLAGTDAPISNISKEVGFSNYNHFFKTFKSYEGINPAAYREKMQKNK